MVTFFIVLLFLFSCDSCDILQMFKGPDQAVEAIYTAPTSAMCGVNLEHDSKEYLITGETTVPIPPFLTSKALQLNQYS